VPERDYGPDIPPDVADKIFVPFHTTKREGGIAATPMEGGGTVFTLRL
jgi:two-component system, NtrC family, nitrogen regulation sensor histidine kinase NtrY